MTFAEQFSNDRYSYFVRLWDEDGENDMDSEDYFDTETEAGAWMDSLPCDADCVIYNGARYKSWQLIRIDWHWHDESVIADGDF